MIHIGIGVNRYSAAPFSKGKGSAGPQGNSGHGAGDQIGPRKAHPVFVDLGLLSRPQFWPDR